MISRFFLLERAAWAWTVAENEKKSRRGVFGVARLPKKLRARLPNSPSEGWPVKEKLRPVGFRCIYTVGGLRRRDEPEDHDAPTFSLCVRAPC
jgi:hypothetical protein